MADIEQLIHEMDQHDDEGIRSTSLTFSISLFTGVTFAEMPQAALRCQEMFFEHCPEKLIRFYATENMRKHRQVNKKVFSMLDLWAKNPETKTDYLSLELKDGDSEQDAPKYLFDFTSAEQGSPAFKSKHANSITMAFPPEFGIERSQEMLGLMRHLLEVVPCTSASAGFAFQCSRYSPQESQAFAWQKSMRHPEIDIVRMPQDNRAAQQNAVKTIGWLTMACDAFVEEVGGLKSIEKGLGAEITRLATPGGSLFKIGDAPTITDRNRGESTPDYKKLYFALRPLIERAHSQSMWFTTGSDDRSGQTESWYRRFER